MKRLLVVLLGLAILGFGTSRGIDWWNFNVNTPVSEVQSVGTSLGRPTTILDGRMVRVGVKFDF